LEECFCNSLQSQNIANIIYYCGKNYKKCNIYIKLCELKDEKLKDRVEILAGE
jgi:hypothetical protein